MRDAGDGPEARPAGGRDPEKDPAGRPPVDARDRGTVPEGRPHARDTSYKASLYEPRPFMLCPVCDHVDRATRRVEIERTPLFRARTRVSAVISWEASSCPVCGEHLMRDCDHCGTALRHPGDLCCRSCGTRYWWHVDAEDVQPVAAWAVQKNSVGRVERFDVFVVQHSLAKIGADALVSSDDLFGKMVGHSATHLRQEAGGDIEKESMNQASIQAGDAWRTPAHHLHAKWVVHVAVNGPDGSTTSETLRRAVGESLRVAEQASDDQDLRVTSIGYPALGTGRSRFSLEDFAGLAREEISRYGRAHSAGPLERIAFVLPAPQKATAFRSSFKRREEPPPRLRRRPFRRDAPA
jgi:O-acetyl-ADP-ribose deacetylase (regulator of RNase III)